MLKPRGRLIRACSQWASTMHDFDTSYIITAALYDESDRRLQYVFVGITPESAGMTVDGMRLYHRDQLIAALEQGTHFSVAYKEHGEWQNGGTVFLVACGDEHFVRSDTQSVAIDDLGNLARIRSSR